jgi:hypothetical protein
MSGETFDIPVGDLQWTFAVEDIGDGQIQATVRQLSGEERDKCLVTNVIDGVTMDRAKMIRLGLVSIDGLSVGGVQIDTAEKLLSTRNRELFFVIHEVFAAILRGSQLEESEAKN